MPRDVIPFPATGEGRSTLVRRTPDVAFAALPLLRQLRNAFELAARRASRTVRWGVPPLFFFHKPAQDDWDAARPPGERRIRAAYADLADDVITLLAGSVEVRRTARAIPRLLAAAETLAPREPRARLIAGLVAIPDDEVVLAINPKARAGWRVRLRGVSDLSQFHVLLADVVPGPRPDGRVVEAHRDGAVDPEAEVATARFQLYRPGALRPDGTLPPSLQAVDQWLWGHESPADLPLVGGERVVLLGSPPYPRTWPAGRRFPMVAGEMDVLDVLGTAAVGEWIASQTGAEPASDRQAA